MQNVTAPPFFLSSPGVPVIRWQKWKKVFEMYAKVCGTNLSSVTKTALLLHLVFCYFLVFLCCFVFRVVGVSVCVGLCVGF